jgi:hypothetical protein
MKATDKQPKKTKMVNLKLRSAKPDAALKRYWARNGYPSAGPSFPSRLEGGSSALETLSKRYPNQD